MFKFLRKKLKEAVSKISKEIDEKAEESEETIEVKPEEKKEIKEPEEKKGFFSKLKDKFTKKEEPKKEEVKEASKEEPKEEKKPEPVKEKPEIKDIPKKEPKVEEKKEEHIPKVKKEEPKVEPAPKVKEEKKEEVKETPKEEKPVVTESKPTTPRETPKEQKEEVILEKEKKIIEEEKKLEKKGEPKVEAPVEKEVRGAVIQEEEKQLEKSRKSLISEGLETKSQSERIETEKEFEKIEVPKKKGFFGAIKEKITTKKLSESQFENIFWNLEIVLMENNVAVEVISKIKQDLKNNIVEKPIIRSKIEKTIEESLKSSIKDLFKTKQFDLLTKIKDKKPFVICFVGVNGSGKTTTLAKMAKLLQNNNLSVVLAASDTFRAASIEQLQKHADNLGIKLIKHDYGSDPAAVAYDAIEHAKSRNLDVVLIDTAGRMHSNINLVDEMKKIIRVSKPDLKIFVGEAITGNDCIEQAQTFNEAISIDAIILAKADIDEKGGVAVSVSYVTGKPIIYLGTGQEYEDLKKFDSDLILDNLGLA